MGGAENSPQRSSSPLKRLASELEPDEPSSQREDVDMIAVPSSDPQEQTQDGTDADIQPRAVSVDMLRDEVAAEIATETATDTATEISDTPASTTPEVPPTEQIPSYDTQISTVTTIIASEREKQLKEGDRIYLVSKKWLDKVLSRGSASKKVENDESPVGPIDNADIVSGIITTAEGKKFARLKPGVTSADDFEIFPLDAWNLVMDWYGLKDEAVAIERFAHNTNPAPDAKPNVIYEYYPPVFVVHRVWSVINDTVGEDTKYKDLDAPIFVASRSVRYMDLLKKMKIAAGIPMSTKVKVWRVPRSLPAAEQLPTPAETSATATPPSSRPTSPTAGTIPDVQDSWKKLLLDVGEFTKLENGSERELLEMDDHTGHEKYNGNIDIGQLGLSADQAIVLDEQIEGTNFVSNTSSKFTKANGIGKKGNSSFSISSQNNSGRNSPTPSGYNLRSITQGARKGRVPGTVGLSNLGNTCYMNSALQCLRSVEELTKYFLSGVYEQEVNRENMLGFQGDIAQAYAALLRDVYKDTTSVAPRSFKSAIGKHASSFSGYGQQDSQEFLGFLLDSLQEDLSRILKKPYIQKPDSTDEMVSDPEAIREMADKVWSITKLRDDSVIADLFTGMYKSTLVCPVCDKVSITFDPFNSLTLQLPIESMWSHTVLYLPLCDRPVRMQVEINKNGTMKSLREFVSRKVGVPIDRLFVAEIFKAKFYKFYDENDIASDNIQANDYIAVYELETKPTNFPGPEKVKTKKNSLSFGKDSDEETPKVDSFSNEQMLVPVFYHEPMPRQHKKRWAITGVPHFIVVTSEEAKSEEAIKRKVLEKAATLCLTDFFTDGELPSTYSASVSDADSGDGKFTAHSMDGEDGIVNIENASNGISKADGAQSTPPTFAFSKKRPSYLDPAEFLPPKIQNMFDLCYFSSGSDPVPTGWSGLEEDKLYPTLASRRPIVEQIDDDDEWRHGSEGMDGSAQSITSSKSSESGNEDGSIPKGRRRKSGSTSSRGSDRGDSPESDDRILAIRPLMGNDVVRKPGSKVGSKKYARKLKTYGKRGLKRGPRKHQQFGDEYDEKDAPDGGPLIRLGEAIIVDWTQGAWTALFDKYEESLFLNSCPLLDDPELVAIRSARATRKKNGLSLDDCLDEYGKEEILAETDTWYCPRCKEQRRASKKLELWKTPDILIMHLKRFSSAGYRRDKVEILVDFPIEGLDLSSRVVETQDGKQEIYDLIAVDDHWGGLGGGHYTAFAKNFHNGEWYEYNDSMVSKQKDVSRIVTSSAYLLFYRRRSEGPLGGEKLQEIVNGMDRSSSGDDESGEGRRLVGNSSQHGSSGALTGVGAAHHQQNHGGGDGEETMTINPADLDSLPSYQENEDEEMPLMVDSIEDEGVDFSMGHNDAIDSKNAVVGEWTFQNLNKDSNLFAGTGSEVGASGDVSDIDVDERSDDVQHGSAPSDTSLANRLGEFDDAAAEDSDGNVWQDEAMPVPDCEEPIDFEKILGIPPTTDENDVDEPAMEIHVEEGEGLKMDEIEVGGGESDELKTHEIHVEEGEGLKID